jgi:hypothetical protein
VEPILDLDDPRVLQRGVKLLKEFAKPSPRPLITNFGVAIAVLLHRSVETAGTRAHLPVVIYTPDSGNPLTTNDLQIEVCDATFEKDETQIPKDATGPIYKPFTNSFKPRSPGGNNWRNSIDIQGGLGCDAPYTDEYLRSDTYVDERRWDCVFRDPKTGRCSSPAGPRGSATCLNAAKRGAPSSTHTRARHRPKLLSRGTSDDPGYWYIEPTRGVLLDLLGSPDRRVPLYPWMAAMYGSSPYFRHWGSEISRKRFERDLKLEFEYFITLFDPDPASPLNADLLSAFGVNGPGTITSGAGGDPTISAGDGSQLSAPVTFRRRSISQLKSRAAANPDPIRRARLLERARLGHQQTLEELVGALRKHGKFRLTEQLDGYDLLAERKGVGHLFEVKTWTSGNLPSQIRRGWAQLREYRFRNAEDLPKDVRLYLVFDSPPPRNLWFWRFLTDDCDVTPLWIKDGEIKTLPGLSRRLP